MKLVLSIALVCSCAFGQTTSIGGSRTIDGGVTTPSLNGVSVPEYTTSADYGLSQWTAALNNAPNQVVNVVSVHRFHWSLLSRSVRHTRTTDRPPADTRTRSGPIWIHRD
jgi:hypothetical protein